MENRSAEETVLGPADVTDEAESSTSSIVALKDDDRRSAEDLSARPEPMSRARPMGVTIISVVCFLGATLIGFVYLAALSQNIKLDLLAIIWPIDVIALFAVGIGLLQLKNWARILAFAIFGINILNDIYSMLSSEVGGGTVLNLAVAALIIWYLRQPQVAEVFE